MSKMTTLGTGQGYAKVSLFGFAGSGKTWSAIDFALGIRNHFGIDAPLAMFDTEGGSEYIAAKVRKETGKDLLGIRSRKFDDLIEVGRECAEQGCVLVVDSMTHVWQDVQDSRLDSVNSWLKEKGRRPKSSLEFQDWNPIKKRFADWTDFFLNSPIHIVTCARARFEYEWESMTTGPDSRKELVKSDVTPKTEKEFGFEPSLVIQMLRESDAPDGQQASLIYRRALVLKDRFGVIDGKECRNPTFDFIKPHIELLTPGAHAPVAPGGSSMPLNDSGDDDWSAEKRQRVILCEEIQSELTARFPSQSAPDKYAKAKIIRTFLGTGSWTKVESMDSAALKQGLESIRGCLNDQDALNTLLVQEAVQ